MNMNNKSLFFFIFWKHCTHFVGKVAPHTIKDGFVNIISCFCWQHSADYRFLLIQFRAQITMDNIHPFSHQVALLYLTVLTNVIKWQYHYLHGVLDLKTLRNSTGTRIPDPLFPHLVPPAIMVWIFFLKYIFEPFIHILQHFVLQLSRSTNFCF
jgi:hypothetical protein